MTNDGRNLAYWEDEARELADEVDALQERLGVARTALEVIFSFGRRNTGYGYSCASRAKEALDELDRLTTGEHKDG